jgi:valyl-tRNA synthetase
MPFITEEIWRRIAPLAGVPGATLMLARWPSSDALAEDVAATAEVDWLKGVILGLRQIRGEMDISPAKKLPLLVSGATEGDREHFARHAVLLGRLAGIEPPRQLATGETAPPSASALVGQMTLQVPMQGLIDPATELARLRRKLEKNTLEITRARAKLVNPNFVNHAPADVVATERERIAQFEQTGESLARQIRIVEDLSLS